MGPVKAQLIDLHESELQSARERMYEAFQRDLDETLGDDFDDYEEIYG